MMESSVNRFPVGTMPNPTKELKPCPFCGSFAQVQAGKQYKMMIQDWHNAEEERYQPCTVRCHKCGLSISRAACNAEHGGANGASRKAKELVIEAWNTRAVESDLAALRSLVRRMQEALKGNNLWPAEVDALCAEANKVLKE